jgi:hypothetical protein
MVRESFFSIRSIVTTLAALAAGLIEQLNGAHANQNFKGLMVLAAVLGIAEVAMLTCHRVRVPRPMMGRLIMHHPLFTLQLWLADVIYQIGQAQATLLSLGLFTAALGMAGSGP